MRRSCTSCHQAAQACTNIFQGWLQPDHASPGGGEAGPIRTLSDLVAFTQASGMSDQSVEAIVETYVTFQRRKRARLGH